MLVECINDKDFHPKSLQFIKTFPVKGDIYFIRARVHSVNGLGYLLEEIHNPIMVNGEEPSFNHRRFKELDDLNIPIDNLLEQIKETQYESETI